MATLWLPGEMVWAKEALAHTAALLLLYMLPHGAGVLFDFRFDPLPSFKPIKQDC